MVFDAAVIEHIAANLRTPFNLLLTCLHFRLRLTAFLEFQFIELRTQVTQSVLAVFRLVARLGVLDHYLVGLTGKRVDELIVQPYAGLDLVDILTACAGRTEGVPTDAGRVDLHLDGIVDERHNEHARETRHALALRVG